MRKSKILVTILCCQLLRPGIAQEADLELASRRVLTDLKAISSFVELAHPCYEQLGLTEYQKQFCESQKNQLFNFDTLTLELTQLKDQNYQKWLEQIDKESPDAKYRASLDLLGLFYQDCKAHETNDQDSNDFYVDEADLGSEEEGIDLDNSTEAVPESDALLAPPPTTQQITLEDIFPVGNDGEISFNVDTYNKMIMSLESYSETLNDSESKAMIESARVEGMKLRKELLLAEPTLLNYALAQSRHYGEPSEIVFRLLQSQTGIDPDEIPVSTKEFYDLYRQYEKVTDDLIAEGYRHPKDFESYDEPPFVIERDKETGEISIFKIDDPKTLPDSRPAFSAQMVIEKLNWSDNLLRKVSLATSTQRPIMENVESSERIHKVLENFSPRIHRWKQKVAQIEQKYSQALSSDKSIDEGDLAYPEAEDFCERERNNLVREFSDQEMVVSFFENKDNRKFMTSKFDETKEIMKETIMQLELSADSRQGMVENLDNVEFKLPEVNTKKWSKAQEQTRDIVDKLMKDGLHDNIYLAYDDATSFLKAEDEFKTYFSLDSLGSSNAFYTPHSDFDNSHSVSAACGIALPSVQNNYPEFFMGIMAHELGHALDPGYSAPNREKYSQKSLEKMDDLRRCLIKNNNGLHQRVSEDFADHIEAHFMAYWMDSSKDDPRWPLRRQRYLHFSYSNICEGDGLKMTSHSDNDYRARHVLSHPLTRREFSEFNLPNIPFCPQLLPKNKGGQR